MTCLIVYMKKNNANIHVISTLVVTSICCLYVSLNGDLNHGEVNLLTPDKLLLSYKKLCGQWLILVNLLTYIMLRQPYIVDILHGNSRC